MKVFVTGVSGQLGHDVMNEDILELVQICNKNMLAF